MSNEYYVLKGFPILYLYKTSGIYSVLNGPIIFYLKIFLSFQDYDDNLYLVSNFFEGEILYKCINEI